MYFHTLSTILNRASIFHKSQSVAGFFLSRNSITLFWTLFTLCNEVRFFFWDSLVFFKGDEAVH